MIGYFGFQELKPSAFPLTIEFFASTDRKGTEAIHHIEVDGPGPVDIPKVTDNAWIRITYASGKTRELVRQ